MCFETLPTGVTLIIMAIQLHRTFFVFPSVTNNSVTSVVRWLLICLLTAIGLTPDGSNRVHIWIQKIHRTTQWNRMNQKGTYITIKKHNKYLYKIKKKLTQYKLLTFRNWSSITEDQGLYFLSMFVKCSLRNKALLYQWGILKPRHF